MSFKLCWEPHGVVIEFSGFITQADAQDATIAYESDLRFDDLTFVIADYTAIDFCIAKPADIEMVAALDIGATLSNPRLHKAVVATAPAVIAMAEHYQRFYLSPIPTEVFSTMADARAWLN